MTDRAPVASRTMYMPGAMSDTNTAAMQVPVSEIRMESNITEALFFEDVGDFGALPGRRRMSSAVGNVDSLILYVRLMFAWRCR